MEIAFYILLVSWVILLVVCIVAIARFKNLHDIYDFSLDTAIELEKTNDNLKVRVRELVDQLGNTEQDIAFWQNKYEKLQKNIGATKEDKLMVIEASYKIDHVRTLISVPKKIANNIKTMDSNDLVELELSMENYIKRAVINDLLYYCNYEVSYEIFNDSYSFLIDIPVARKTGDKSVYEHAEILYPMVDIFKKLTEGNKEV